MRVGILTSVETRHRYFVQALRRGVQLVAVAYEQTGFNPSTVAAGQLTPRESYIVAEHFAERARQEQSFFGKSSDFVTDGQGIAVRRLPRGILNSAITLDLLESAAVDTVVVYGTNLIRQPLLGRFAGRLINLHLGLSPYYRGTATNFYPLLNEEPEYVGATIHLIDSGIDSGPIFRHARPQIVAEDGPHTIGCKAILAGIEAMISVLEAIERGLATPVPQWEAQRPRLYLRRDYHPRDVVELHRKIEAGLIPDYVRRAVQAAGAVRVVE